MAETERFTSDGTPVNEKKEKKKKIYKAGVLL